MVRMQGACHCVLIFRSCLAVIVFNTSSCAISFGVRVSVRSYGSTECRKARSSSSWSMTLGGQGSRLESGG
ncbi:hypothetical protein M6B38_305800 [Iris pallida]|uniref:Secreted protein n=1 Tax=Iris pallida TaxID=29817 RepID=A0AAX6HMZ6_IRIPA|nr:hypothetical protein M6B38_305800 [Iris pallida]